MLTSSVTEGQPLSFSEPRVPLVREGLSWAVNESCGARVHSSGGEVLTASTPRSSHAVVGHSVLCGKSQGFWGEAARVSHVWKSVCGTFLFFFQLSLHPPWASNLKPWDEESRTLPTEPTRHPWGTFRDLQNLCRGFLLPLPLVSEGAVRS